MPEFSRAIPAGPINDCPDRLTPDTGSFCEKRLGIVNQFQRSVLGLGVSMTFQQQSYCLPRHKQMAAALWGSLEGHRCNASQIQAQTWEIMTHCILVSDTWSPFAASPMAARSSSICAPRGYHGLLKCAMAAIHGHIAISCLPIGTLQQH